MYFKKTVGYVSMQNSTIKPYKKPFDYQLYRVIKSGKVLMLSEENSIGFCKSANIASIANKGFVYYQVISNQGFCERCEEHNGAIYPVSEAKAGENLPPFH